MATQQGVIKSDNGGNDWSPSNSGMQFIGGTLSVAENDKTTLYLKGVSTSDLNYRSLDAGLNWTSFSTEFACDKFVINPTQSTEIICQSYSQLYISKDAGDTWNEFSNTLDMSLIQENKLVAYASDGLTIYSVLNGKSEDAGNSWSEFLLPGVASNLLVSPANPDIIYTVNTVNTSEDSPGVYKSLDGGTNWQKILEIQKNGTPTKLIIHPLNSEQLAFVSTRNEIYITDNAGSDWKKIFQPETVSFFSSIDVVFNPKNLEGLFARTEEGLFKTLDKGISWNKITKNLENDNFRGFLNLHANSELVFASYRSGKGVYKLAEPVNTECLFEWAEQQYPQFFSPDSVNSQNWGGYIYRYYPNTNTYLGIFHEKEVHILQTNINNNITSVGSFEFYQNQAGCN